MNTPGNRLIFHQESYGVFQDQMKARYLLYRLMIHLKLLNHPGNPTFPCCSAISSYTRSAHALTLSFHRYSDIFRVRYDQYYRRAGRLI